MSLNYLAYIKDCWSATRIAWQSHEKMVAIFGALITALVALISMLIFPIYTDKSFNGIIVVLLGYWFVFLFLFVSPYLLWRKNRASIVELERNFEPKLSIDSRISPDGKFSEILVRNVSGRTVSGLNVELANTRRGNDFVGDEHTVMTANTGQKCPMTIDPNSTAYFQFASPGLEVSGVRSIQLYGGKDRPTHYVQFESLDIKFNVSANDIARQPYIVTVRLDENDALVLGNN